MELQQDLDVLVLASTTADRKLLAEHIVEIGLTPVYLESNLHYRNSNKTYRAVVICVRQFDHGNYFESARLNTIAKRILVCSDINSETSIVGFLTAGAHHYINLTESPMVISARISAALRIHGECSEPLENVAPFKIDTQNRKILLRNKCVALSPMEFAFANYLFSNKDKVVSASELLFAVWGLPSRICTRRIDTSASRIRKKMPLDISTGWYLRSVRGRGYILQNGKWKLTQRVARRKFITPYSRCSDIVT